MAEHWCKEHKQIWFKKGNMKGFAHPIIDDNGEPTAEWCNEPKSEKEAIAKTGYRQSTPEDRASIEHQTIYIHVMDNWEKNLPNRLKLGVVNWALSKLGIDLLQMLESLPSAPQAPTKAVKQESKPTLPEGDKQPLINLDWLEEQLELLKDTKGWAEANLLAYLNNQVGKKFGTVLDAAANLKESDAKDFIALVEKAVAKVEK